MAVSFLLESPVVHIHCAGTGNQTRDNVLWADALVTMLIKVILNGSSDINIRWYISRFWAIHVKRHGLWPAKFSTAAT